MTVDTSVKMVEGEKRGLDMGSYEDLHSSPTVATSVGGNGSGDCNVDGKDDYVFVNGSDGAFSDDHGESNDDGVVDVVESSVERGESNDQLGIGNVGSDGVCNGVRENGDKIDGGEPNVENGGDVGEESEKENGGIKVEREVVEVECHKSESNVEGVPNDEDKVFEGGNSKVEIGGNVGEKSEVGSLVKENGEIKTETEVVEVGSGRSESTADRRTDVGDKVSEHVEGSDSTPVVDEVMDEETGFENYDNERGSGDGVAPWTPDVDYDEKDVAVGDGVSPEAEGQESIVVGSVSVTLEAHEVVACNGSVVVEVPLPSDGDDKGLPLTDAMLGEQAMYCQQQDLQPADGEAEDMNLNEAEPEIREQGDVEPVLETLSCQSEEAQIQDNLDSALPGVDGPASARVVQSDESKAESGSGEAETVKVDVQSDTTDEPAVTEDPAWSNESSGSELAAEVGGSQEALAVEDFPHTEVEEQNEAVAVMDKEIGGSQELSAGEDVSQHLVPEHTDSVDAIDKEVSSEDHGSEKPSLVKDATSLLKLEPADGFGVVDHCNDHGDSHAKVGVTVRKDVTASNESSGDAKSCVRSESINSTAPVDNVAELPVEQGAVDDSSVPLGDSAGDTSSVMKVKDSNRPLLSPVSDAKWVTESLNREAAPEAMISFGSFMCATPLVGNDVKLRTDKMNEPPRFSSGSSNPVVNSANEVTFINRLAYGVPSSSLNDGSAAAQVAQSLQISDASASNVEHSEAKSPDDQKVNPDLGRSQCYWLIKIPYFDDEKLKEQKRQSEAQHTEKTRIRDAIAAEYQKRKASVREAKAILDAAKSEERAARELMMVKRKELESAHSLINLARHMVDVDAQIHTLEHRLNHETVELKEEKHMLRELNQLKQQRGQLSANSRRQQEVQHALDRKDETEEHLKVLKKELDALRESCSKASERVASAKNTFETECALLNNLSEQLTSAQCIQQEAYTHDRNLRRQSYEKNKYLYEYRDDLRIARDYADTGKTDMLERHCINQVEKIMELWNQNDEFRKEYVRWNMNSMIRKFGTLDGRRLGLDEKPQSLVNVLQDRVNSSAEVKSVTAVSNVERDFPVLGATKSEDKVSKKLTGKKAAPAQFHEGKSKNSSAEVSGKSEIEEDKQELKLSKEEEEWARKAEELRKEEEAARLREQHRLEEKVKAQKALERKKRAAERAQAKAEFKARKEAEEKEKERQKRANKKEKKRGLKPEITEEELPQPSEPASDVVREREVATGKPAALGKRPTKASLHTKQIKTTAPIPPALRNRGRRGLLRYWPYALLLLVAIAVLFLGNLDTVALMQQRISGLLH